MSEQYENAIAIVGISGRFPGAENIDNYWQNLISGLESVQTLTEQELLAAGVNSSVYQQENFVAHGSILADHDRFDAAYFDISPVDAAVKDPQHKALLECAEDALLNAGYLPKNFHGLIGVYAGIGSSGYLLQNLATNADIIQRMGIHALYLHNEKDFASTFVSYKLGLNGPSLSINCGCSTSLVAVHTACKALMCYECDMAVAGAASIAANQKTGYLYQDGFVLSADGHCKPFDAEASGTLPGHGVGLVVLKRYQEAVDDGDHIHAVILGSAINNDGNDKISFTAPSIQGQSAVINHALQMADIDPETVSYIETHGTGTRLGDPIEFEGLRQQYDATAETPCYLGAVKANIGHLNAASGVAGLLKAVKVVQTGMIPPAIHFKRPNPEIPLDKTRFKFNHDVVQLNDDQPRRAGISSFGIGGTNAHVIIEQPPVAEYLPGWPFHILPISGTCERSLQENIQNLCLWLQQDQGATPLAEVAYTLQIGRRELPNRVAVVAANWQDAIEKLAQAKACKTEFTAKTIFCFPGQGAQYSGMAKALFDQTTVFSEQLRLCDQLFAKNCPISILDLIYQADNSDLEKTQYTQPVLFSVSYALARQWQDWGVEPSAMIGHSLGEFVAACLAGVLSLDDAVKVVAARAQCMAEAPPGAMLSVRISAAELKVRLTEGLWITGENGPEHFVIGGRPALISAFEAQHGETFECRPLATCHAFHSPDMQLSADKFRQIFAEVRLAPPSRPFISNVTGTFITELQACSPDYWVEHMLAPVKIGQGLLQVTQPNSVLIETGPGRSLITLAAHTLETTCQRVASLPHARENKDAFDSFAQALAGLWLAGVPIQWPALHKNHRRRRVSLPGYAFQRQKHWVDAPFAQTMASMPADKIQSSPRKERPSAEITLYDSVEDIVTAEISDRLGVRDFNLTCNFFEIGGDSMMATQIVSRLKNKCGTDIKLSEFLSAPTLNDVVSIMEAKMANFLEREAGEI